MTTATKNSPAPAAPAKAGAPPVKPPVTPGKPVIDFSTLQVVEGGEIVRKGREGSQVNRLEGTPIVAQLKASYEAKDDTGKGKTFTVGPVPAESVKALQHMYNLGAKQLHIGVSFSYNDKTKGLTVRAQDRKAFDPTVRAQNSAIRKSAVEAAKAAGKSDEEAKAAGAEAVKAAHAK